MLHKLLFFKTQYKDGKCLLSVQDDVELKTKVETLVRHFYPTKTINDAFTGDGRTGGRSSFCFFCDDNKGEYRSFIKVNPPGEGNKILLYKEYIILSKIYDGIVLGFYDIDESIGALEMKVLSRKQLTLSPNQAKSIIDYAKNKMNEIVLPEGSCYDIECLLSESKNDLDFLYSKKLLLNSYERVKELLSAYGERLSKEPRTICHGDFGDVNILFNGDSPVVIDWEDAFWGISNYDYLYWLSFFPHRRFYSPLMFGDNKADRAFNITVMIMIILIKETMAYYNGEIRNNRLPAEDRVSELLSFA